MVSDMGMPMRQSPRDVSARKWFGGNTNDGSLLRHGFRYTCPRPDDRVASDHEG